MKYDILKELIKRKKGKSALKIEIEDDGLMKKDEESRGLAPDNKVQPKKSTEVKGEPVDKKNYTFLGKSISVDLDDDYENKDRAEKQMDAFREAGYELEQEDVEGNEEKKRNKIAQELIDETVLRQLKDGKKPNNIWERMQANLAKRS